MSGHSKWSTIKRQKAVTDARRSAVFTKYGRLISVAARQGGPDPAMNFRLRLAIDKAKGVNMPNDNIDRAIKAGSGGDKDTIVKDVVYEGFGPAGVAVMVQAITDNSNRTTAEVRTVFTKHGGSMGGQNSVGWMFDLKGVVRIPLSEVGERLDELELGLIDAGADDVNEDDGALVITAAPEKLSAVRDWLQQQGIKNMNADVERLPTTTVAVTETDRDKLYGLLEALDELDDVTGVDSNDV